MRVLRGIYSARLPPIALTIGNFDGLHHGHQAMLAKLKEQAANYGLSTALLTFEPHPREFFSPKTAPARLSSLREKLEYFAACPLDYVIVQPFNTHFAALSAACFCDEWLTHRLNAKYLLVGDDFRFGSGRKGDYALLMTNPNFILHQMETVYSQGIRVSSTAVRDALAVGDLALVEHLLGHPYILSGRVMKGKQWGRKSGFPTANIHIKHNHPPLNGVFVVDVVGLEKSWQGVANLGLRPTLKENIKKPVLEVHLFDFNRDIYHAHLQVRFMHKLRDEKQYPDWASLNAQIALDCEAARQWWKCKNDSVKPFSCEYA